MEMCMDDKWKLTKKGSRRSEEGRASRGLARSGTSRLATLVKEQRASRHVPGVETVGPPVSIRVGPCGGDVVPTTRGFWPPPSPSLPSLAGSFMGAAAAVAVELRGDRSGDESAVTGRGKKGLASPGTPPSDGEDSGDSWVDSGSGSEEDQEDQNIMQNNNNVEVYLLDGMHRPFTVDDFPRLSSDHSVQTETPYDITFQRFTSEGLQHMVLSLTNAGISLVLLTDSMMNLECEMPKSLAYAIDNYEIVCEAKDGNLVCKHVTVYFHTNLLACGHLGMSCLSLTSPARGICITCCVLFEFQPCIRTEDSSEAEDEDEPKVRSVVWT
uniref:Uncharacterized protein n=1 Tax=Oryza brachyantha TaxID=4533 RepID=J3NED5_ORYBR